MKATCGQRFTTVGCRWPQTSPRGGEWRPRSDAAVATRSAAHPRMTVRPRPASSSGCLRRPSPRGRSATADSAGAVDPPGLGVAGLRPGGVELVRPPDERMQVPLRDHTAVTLRREDDHDRRAMSLSALEVERLRLDVEHRLVARGLGVRRAPCPADEMLQAGDLDVTGQRIDAPRV